MARKIGATVFALPEDIVEVNDFLRLFFGKSIAEQYTEH